MSEISNELEVLATTTGSAQQEIGEVNKLIEEIKKLSDCINDATQNMLANMETIQQFTKNIQSISSKTNMLSLNASIEAARSGEMGRGFAVVANQMRTLANDTKDSSTQILQVLEKFTEDMDAMKDALQKQASCQQSQIEATQNLAADMTTIENTTQEILERMS